MDRSDLQASGDILMPPIWREASSFEDAQTSDPWSLLETARTGAYIRPAERPPDEQRPSCCAELSTTRPTWSSSEPGEARLWPVLQPDDKAPDFALPDQNGNPVKLSDLRGQTVVLYFYPRADTGINSVVLS
jgi:hypothetical protein